MDAIDILKEAVRLCAAAHRSEFIDWSKGKAEPDDSQISVRSETVPLVADVRMICEAVFGNSSMVFVDLGNTTVYLDECKPLDKIDYDLLRMALPEEVGKRFGPDSVEVQQNDVEPEEKVLENAEEIDAFLNLGSESYGMAFDRARQYLKEVEHKMGEAIGWKHPSLPFDFYGFSGYSLEIGTDRVDVVHGTGKDNVIASFYSKPDGSLGFVPYGEEFVKYGEDVNPWYPLADIMNGNLCLTQENISQARKEFHNGNMVIFGIRYGEAVAFGVMPEDDALRSLLAERDINVRFTSPKDLENAFQRWFDKAAKAGVEPAINPEIVLYYYDGRNLRSEREISMVSNREMRQGWEKDWAMIDALRKGGEEIRSELERAAGLPEGLHFKFSDVIVPSTILRSDALFLTNRFGLPGADFLTVVNGSVALFRGYVPGESYSVKKVSFDSVEDALKAVRKVCMKDENISKARNEYLAVGKALEAGNGIKIK